MGCRRGGMRMVGEVEGVWWWGVFGVVGWWGWWWLKKGRVRDRGGVLGF